MSWDIDIKIGGKMHGILISKSWGVSCSSKCVYPECRGSPVCSPHLGRIPIDVDDGGADHFGQVRRVVSGPAAVLGRREAHLRFRLATCIETVG